MTVFSHNEKWLISAAFLLCGALYWPALTGLPVWDDLTYWFYNPEMKLSYSEFWRFFSWPVTFTVQKLMLDLLGERFFLYHLLSLILHFVNAWLVFVVAKRLNWPKPSWVFLLFLLHPANVASVGWMIQIKTLLCFLFGILSFLAFEHGLKDRRFLWLAFLLFCLSLLSKSASVCLPVLFFMYANGRVPSRALLLWSFFFVLAAAIGSVLLISRNPEFATTAVRASSRLEFVAMTSRYYLTQSLWPLENAPIKGRSPVSADYLDLSVLGLLLAMAFFIRKSTTIVYVVAGFVLLIPFLGFLYAPYMVFTWVSDQHLYLALPFLLAFWISLIGRLSGRPQQALLAGILAMFAFKTFKSANFYHDEDQFYTESLRVDPGNVIAAFNYANTLAYADRVDEALVIANKVHEFAEKDPAISLHPQFNEIEHLRGQLLAFKETKKK